MFSKHRLVIFYLFFWNLLNTEPTTCTIGVVLLFAISFPIAFPPTVKAATTALNKNCILKENPKLSVIFIAISALIAPLNTPHISPITSAQILATLGAFFISCIDVFAPLTFFVAFAWNSSSFATVTATPTISNKIPTNITNTNTKIAGIKLNLDTPFVEIYENIKDSINVIIKISIYQTTLDFFECSFLVSFSCFFYVNKNKTK